MANTGDVTNLMRDALRTHLLEQMPAAVIHYPYGEPETMLADVMRRKLIPNQADQASDLPVGAGSFETDLRVRAIKLTSAAIFLKLYPDRDLTRYISRGGLTSEIYAMRDFEKEREAYDKEGKKINIPRTLGDVLEMAVRATTDIKKAYASATTDTTYNAWIDTVAQTIGRPPMVTTMVSEERSAIPSILNDIVKIKSTLNWEDEIILTLMGIYYLILSKSEDALLYKSDYGSAMFTRFVSIRLRDYSAFYTSLCSIPTLLKIRLLERSSETLLLVLGDASAPTSTVENLKNSLAGALSAERMRLGTMFMPLIDKALEGLLKAHNATHLLDTTQSADGLFAEFDEGKDIWTPLQLNPSYADVKAGPSWVRKTYSDSDINIIRTLAMGYLRDALKTANGLAAAMPPLEPGSTLFNTVPNVDFQFPDCCEPRFMTVSDSGPLAVGISAVEIDEKGILIDKLLPHMGRMFNYTAYTRHNADMRASRLLASPKDSIAGLPGEVCNFPVPINYLEGEKSMPVTLSLRDINKDGIDYLRRLEALFASMPYDEVPYALSQLAASFILLCKPEYMSRIKGVEGIRITDDWIALTPKFSSSITGYKASQDIIVTDQYTYGYPAHDLIKENIDRLTPDAVQKKGIYHPDQTVMVALCPLTVVPKPRTGEYDYVYVHASIHRLVPVSHLVRIPEPFVWETVHFSTMTALRHGQNWFSVARKNSPNRIIQIQQPGVTIGFLENIVGYLSEDALMGSPSPFKSAKPEVNQKLPTPQPVTEVLPNAPAPAATEEKL